LYGATDRPDFFIVPRNVVVAYIYVGHRAWLTATGKTGKPHQPNTARNVEARAIRSYQENWTLLEEPVDSVPCWFQIGFSVGHHTQASPMDTPDWCVQTTAL
jgi:hypothetical protein